MSLHCLEGRGVSVSKHSYACQLSRGNAASCLCYFCAIVVLYHHLGLGLLVLLPPGAATAAGCGCRGRCNWLMLIGCHCWWLLLSRAVATGSAVTGSGDRGWGVEAHSDCRRPSGGFTNLFRDQGKQRILAAVALSSKQHAAAGTRKKVFWGCCGSKPASK